MLHSGSIRMEGMQHFASKIRKFCMQIRMDGKLSQTELSSLKFYYLSLTLRVAFPSGNKKIINISRFGFKC